MQWDSRALASSCSRFPARRPDRASGGRAAAVEALEARALMSAAPATDAISPPPTMTSVVVIVTRPSVQTSQTMSATLSSWKTPDPPSPIPIPYPNLG